MHEFSLMTELISTVLDEMKRHNMTKVEKVYLEIGTLTFAGEDQMRWAYEVLTRDNILKHSELIIEKKEPKVSCSACGYGGDIEYEQMGEANDLILHMMIPRFTCPKCKGPISIIEGRDCIVRNIVGTVDVEDEKKVGVV